MTAETVLAIGVLVIIGAVVIVGAIALAEIIRGGRW